MFSILQYDQNMLYRNNIISPDLTFISYVVVKHVKIHHISFKDDAKYSKFAPQLLK